jgi:AraC family transcriptional regulator of adaptative response / DNA-3-methyladenine glycosylase II
MRGRLDGGRLPDLAADLGVTCRHLRRAFRQELGVTPIEMAQTKRLALAKQLLHDTSLPLTQIAFASGFTSVRRFNASFRERFGRSPSTIRREGPRSEGRVSVALGYREPLAWDALLEFLAPRAVPGTANVGRGCYRQTVRIGHSVGWIEARREEASRLIRVGVSPSLLPYLNLIATRTRACKAFHA